MVTAGVPIRIPLVTNGDCGIVGDRVLVHGDARLAQHLLRRLAGEILGPEVHQHEVGVGSARDDGKAALDQRAGQSLGVLHHLAGVDLEVVGQRLAECHRLGRDDVLQRTALGAGNTDLSMALACSMVQRIRPARGPRSVLCVVLVTTCACGTGEG